MIIENYTAADIFPVKLSQDYLTIKCIVEDSYIRPVHLQICPTNKCTRSCNFCSCSNRDKSSYLDMNSICTIIRTFQSMGCDAVTITGGGEPLCHNNLDEIIKEFVKYNINVGVVTNADLINCLPDEIWNLITWCRISCSDEFKITDKWIKPIERLATSIGNVSWAFSYVLTRSPDVDNLIKHIEVAERVGMTHVRIVSDILDYSNIPEIDNIDSKLVIRQKRDKPKRGNKDCWISLLKPVIDATGRIFPCCGVQYAERESSRDFVDNMCMGKYEDAISIWNNLERFDGSNCTECYYTDYNNFLSKLMLKLDHNKFV